VGSEEVRTKENQTIARGHKHCETIGVDYGGVTSLAEVVM
jgi:type III restriction enzyme